MSIIAAGTTTTTALSSTGNTDGTIQLQVNGTTPSVTLNALGAVGVGAVPNFGTSGQALVSAGSTAAPTWTTIAASQWTTSGSNISYTAGQVQIGTGSAAAPALSVASDTNTGIFFPAADTIAFAEGGAEVARFDASGNLLLGTTSGSERLVVTGATGDIARITDNTNAPLLFGTNANGPYVFTPSSAALRFGTFNTERARITSTGAWSFGSSGTATGTSGQVLTSAGSGAAPTWTTPAGGSWVKLSSSAAFSNSVLDLTGFVTSDYNTYAVVVYAYSIQSGSYGAFRFFVGGTLRTSGYTGSGFYSDASGALLARGGSSGTSAQLVQLTNATNTDLAGVIFINANNFNSLTGTSIPSVNSQLGGGSFNTNFYQSGSLNTTSPITGIRFYVEGSGTFAGYFDLYGIKR